MTTVEHLKMLKSPRILSPNNSFHTPSTSLSSPVVLHRPSDQEKFSMLFYSIIRMLLRECIVLVYCYLLNHSLISIPLYVMYPHGTPAMMTHICFPRLPPMPESPSPLSTFWSWDLLNYQPFHGASQSALRWLVLCTNVSRLQPPIIQPNMDLDVAVKAFWRCYWNPSSDVKQRNHPEYLGGPGLISWQGRSRVSQKKKFHLCTGHAWEFWSPLLFVSLMDSGLA